MNTIKFVDLKDLLKKKLFPPQQMLEQACEAIKMGIFSYMT